MPHAEHFGEVEPDVLCHLPDNVIVFGCSEEEHLECLHIVFEHFREFNLKLKPSKCSFFQSEIVYLVHHISQEGIHPNRDNVYMIKEFPMPETHSWAVGVLSALH